MQVDDKTYKTPDTVKLFRYDIECPPDNWNTDFKTYSSRN